MLDWYAARMMAWVSDLEAAGWKVVDCFPSEHFPEYDHLVTCTAMGRPGLEEVHTNYPCSYADGTPREVQQALWDRKHS